ncbi:hypothetical protein ACLKMH_24140 [Psychromonas sp. KJ10-10]|uniref:hypothetical protein n=1 Tax=Psychromonas sp. KJ10-10 TaxID=3391823 RepID=UPI0039B49878
MIDKQTINFWNGNKSPARQAYELALLELLLANTNLRNSKVSNDLTDHPKAEDEGNVFEHQTDILVTVAGNKKFHHKPLISLKTPICKGLLGQRVLIIRKQDQTQFTTMTTNELKQKIAGIPATWVDADLFRLNGFKVLEEGSLAHMFQQLKDKKCDYVSLGVNEAQSLLNEYNNGFDNSGDLSIEDSLLISYPLPLVFYVHPERQDLAEQLKLALQDLQVNADWENLFELHYGQFIRSLNVKNRRQISLKNPNIPKELQALPRGF